MATTSPSPNSSESAVSPTFSDSPPPPPPLPPRSPPPEPSNSPPPGPPFSDSNETSPGGSATPPAPPPLSSPNTPSPPPISPPPMGSSPPPTTFPPPQVAPPPTEVPPPPADGPPPSSSPPPNPSTPPPLPSSPPPKPSSPPLTSPPPPPSDPPASPPPPPATNPPESSPPPPPSSSTPPTDPPPLPLEPPKSAPPPPRPPESSPPPPSTDPPNNSPPPPSPDPPQNSPPSPPSANPPENLPPSPPSPNPPQNSPPPPATEPPRSSPPPPASRPPSNPSPPPRPPSGSPPNPGSPPSSSSPPPPFAQLSPPAPPGSPPSPSGPSLVPPNAPTTNESDSSNPRRGEGIGTGASVALGLAITLLLLGVVGAAAWCLCKRKKKVPRSSAGYVMPTSLRSSPAPESALLKPRVSEANGGSGHGQSSPSEPGGLGNSRSWFTYGELSEATSGFSAQYLLGVGGFGSVYKGILADGREVAVKQLRVGGGQGDREFRAEVEIISRVHHRHLVSLVGYCISDSSRLLVYDYVPNDTLHFHLHGEGTHVLNWAARVKIAIGAARGIAYLHEDCHPRIIHRDIKSSNILLDSNFEAQVSDFGLAKLCLDTNTHVTTRVMGTFGYMAPEYASSGKLTEKSDVFSFGVVLLELISGRKPVDSSQPLGDESLVEWARPLLSHALDTQEFQQLVDPRLEKHYVDSEMFLMIEAAAACVRHSSAKRPRMTQVVRAFDSMSTSDLSNGMRVGESELFNSAQQSEEIRLFRRMAFGGSQDFGTDFYKQSSSNSEQSTYVRDQMP